MSRHAVISFGLLFIGFITLSCFVPAAADAGGKVGIYGVYMSPYGVDARNSSRPGFGIGGLFVAPVPAWNNAVAIQLGGEYINLLSKSISMEGEIDGIYQTFDQVTSQHYSRIYIGPRMGAHGEEFFRPYMGADLSLTIYGIGTKLSLNDPESQDGTSYRDIDSRTKVVAGFDVMAGVDLNISNSYSIDAGVRYVKSFSLPQQLGEGAETVYPQYFQVTIGFGLSFSKIGQMMRGGEEEQEQE
jgi:opacity protein-like surface antigen